MNDYLAYQGLRQEVDALRVENARLMDAHAEDMRLFTASMDALRAQVAELREALDKCLPFVSRYEEQYGSNIALDACSAARAALEMSGGVK